MRYDNNSKILKNVIFAENVFYLFIQNFINNRACNAFRSGIKAIFVIKKSRLICYFAKFL